MKYANRTLNIVILVMTLMVVGTVQADNLKDMGGANLILTNGKICTEAATVDSIHEI